MSENITAAIQLNGEAVTKQPLIKSMRVVKKETLKLISDWISRSNDNGMVLDNFIPPFLDAVLLDYQRTQVPSAREPEVLSAIATIVNKLESHITLEVSKKEWSLIIFMGKFCFIDVVCLLSRHRIIKKNFEL